MAGDLPWLRTLETKIHAAARRLQELRQENRDLKRRVAELERQGKETRGGQKPPEATWETERREIRRRVEELAQGLEKTLEQFERPLN